MTCAARKRALSRLGIAPEAYLRDGRGALSLEEQRENNADREKVGENKNRAGVRRLISS